MARKKITANLNGGDAVTAMGDLLFQIYDASDDSIIATANYAAIGSVNTNGTDGGNINYTLNPTYNPGSGLLGQIILDGVDIGDAEELKIRCKDELGNESILSDSYAVGIIMFEDDFTGTVIDVSKWTEINPDADLPITQDDELKIQYLGTTSSSANKIYSPAFQVVAASFDLTKVLQNNTDYWQLGIYDNLAPQNRMQLVKTSSAGYIAYHVYIGGTKVVDEIILIDISVKTTFKFVNDGANLSLYTWGGSAWQLSVASYVGSISQDLFFHITGFSSGNTGETLYFDNAVLTSADYATQRPV